VETVPHGAGPLLWRPSRSAGLGLSIVRAVVALAAAYVALVIASAGRTPRPLTITVADVVETIVVLVLALLAHEGVRGLAISTYGGRPRFSVSYVRRVIPYVLCTAPGQRFLRTRYAILVLFPTLFVSLALLVGLRSPAGGVFVIPFGIHLGMCTSDWAVAFRALREPPGVLIEDVVGGILIHPPAWGA
jgi:Putative zincin peptidase